MRFWSNPRQRLLAANCLLWTALTVFLHLMAPPYQGLESSTGDWLMSNNFARLSPPNPQLLFLAIDEESRTLSSTFSSDIEKSPALQLMKNGFPWNRQVYALTIERLLDAGARAVVLDMMFPGPREGDPEFRAALDKYRDRVVIGSNLQVSSDDANLGQTTVNNKPRYIVPSETLMDPGPPYDQRIGFVNVYPDPMGDKIRRAHYRTTLLEFFGKPPVKGDETLVSLAARTLEKAGYGDKVPATHEPTMFRFAEEIRPRSLHEIFVEDQWAKPPYDKGELFRDKIVLIGAAGNQAEDRLQTPFGVTLGPLIHLSAINAALNGDFLHETSRGENLALIGAGGVLAWLLGSMVRKPVQRAVMLLGSILAIYIAAQLLFNLAGIFPILLSPLVALAGSGFTWSAWEQLHDWLEKQKLRKTFERYVSKDVVKELVDNPQSFLNSLSGERKPITVLFSDVRGFTTMTESADPHALVLQLNEYFNDMVGIVFSHHGTLDKFIGDAVMAHWGSIVSEGVQTDACRALRTGVEMRRRLAALNAGWKARGIQELSFGIGINHGEAIVGNLGCEAKMEVSVIGDAVNLASRLEGVTKTYHIDMCIGELVAPLVREAFLLRSLDLILVKGKTRPVEIFAVLEERKPGMAEPAWLARHEEAMRLYRAGDFPAAAGAWNEVLAQQPGDSIAEVFLERCAELQKHPPEHQWDGVFEMKSK